MADYPPDAEPYPSPQPATKIVGITGGIGSGKSTVSGILEQLGYRVYNSDFRAKHIVNENLNLKNSIINLLGADAYDAEGNYDRRFVASKVFGDDDLLSRLNGLIHPGVALDFQSWVTNSGQKIVFKETALLFELGLHQSCSKSLLVTADDKIRIKRVMDRDGRTYREVESVMQKQMPEKEKIRLADYVIYNNSTLEELEEQTKLFLQNLLSELT